LRAFGDRRPKWTGGGGGWIKHGDRDFTLKFWDVSTGQLLETVDVARWWRGSRSIRFGDMAFSPDGNILAVPVGNWRRDGSWGELRLWNIERKALEAVTLFSDHPSPVTATAFTPDGKTLVAGCGDGRLRVWDLTRE